MASATVPPDRLSEQPGVEDLPPPLVVRSFGKTHTGKVRRSNEDNFLIAELVRALWIHQSSLSHPEAQYGRNRAHIFLVADGMGGHEAGELASALGVSSIEAFVLHILHRFSNLELTDAQTVVTDLQAALRRADARIFEETAHHPEFSGMGTTLTLALVSGWNLFVIHAGDSRCYLHHGGKLRQLTLDHTVAGELARRGLITPDQAGHHQFRHVVTNVLGGSEEGVRVEVQRLDLETGNMVLLCSDGLTDMLDDETITAIMDAGGEPRAICERLVEEANERGGKDNITAIVARFEAV
jgi:PPM family protein phosphatase